jgi:lysophospholipase L1-like esterase
MRTVLKLAAPLIALVLVAPLLNHASRRVAFMGDSITQGWAFPRANFGIFGQTTAQMLARFPNQIPNRNFRTVVILGGTNDTLLGIDPAFTIANLSRMVDLARAAGVEPILAEIPPIYKQNGRFLPAVQRLNAGIVTLAATKHVRLADYYDALLNHPSCFSDGTHLKRRGYLRMEVALLQTQAGILLTRTPHGNH